VGIEVSLGCLVVFSCSVFSVQCSVCRVQGAGLRVQCAGCRVQEAGFRIESAGLRLPMLMVPGFGVRVCCRQMLLG
jgi:hypothetical protein